VVTTKGGSSGTRSSGRTTQRSKACDAGARLERRFAGGQGRGPGRARRPRRRPVGLGLITVGILLGLAVYGAALGPVGRSVDSGLGYLIGWSRYIVPPLCVLGGAAIIAGRTRPDPTRTVLGGVLGLVAVSGLASWPAARPLLLVARRPERGGRRARCGVGHSLERAIGTAGAAVVFVVVAIVAVLLATGISCVPSAGARLGRAPSSTQPRALVGCGPRR